MTTTIAAAYLERLGVPAGPPDDDLLTRVVRAHVATFPFENLDPFLGVEPPLSGPDVATKMVHDRRGGWCFEHNTLLRDVLREIGFDVTALVARVRLGRAADGPPGMRDHMLLSVRTPSGTHTADAGFGGMVPPLPLALVEDAVQPTPMGGFSYRREPDDTWVLVRHGADGPVPLYAFDLRPAPDADYAMASWYLTHHPDSPFRAELSAALTGERERWTLSGYRLTRRGTSGDSTVTELDSPAAVREALRTVFGIDTGGLDGLEDRIREVHPASPRTALS